MSPDRGRYRLVLAAISLFPAIVSSAPPAKCKVEKADTVIVDNGERSTMMGAIEYSMGTGGTYTGSTGGRKPAGPVIIFIIRQPSPAGLAALRKMLPNAHDGAVYLWPKGSLPKAMQYLCDVDTKQNEDQLAALFGIDAGKRPHAASAPKNR